MEDLEKRKKLAIANSSRMFLYFNNFITEKQNEIIHEKIKRHQDKNKVKISCEQLNSVDYVYNDNPKCDFDCQFIVHGASYDWGDDYIFVEINGNASGRVYTLKEEEGVAYIEGLHVSEKERQKGIGKDLIDKLIDKCKEIGTKECMLWCDKSKWVYEWYQRLGFVYYADKQDQEGVVWMCKKINNKD